MLGDLLFSISLAIAGVGTFLLAGASYRVGQRVGRRRARHDGLTTADVEDAAVRALLHREFNGSHDLADIAFVDGVDAVLDELEAAGYEVDWSEMAGAPEVSARGE